VSVAPDDPVGDAVVDALGDVLFGASVTLTHSRAGDTADTAVAGDARATGVGPEGWVATITISLEPRVARLLLDSDSPLGELLDALPAAGLRATERLRGTVGPGGAPPPALRRAARDVVAAELLDTYLTARLDAPPRADLVAETIEYLIELSGTRVEAHDLTHGVVVADVLHDTPRLEVRYPDDLRAAKRAPLLFDGQRSVLVIDGRGRARTELQRHRFDRLGGGPAPRRSIDALDGGALVALATRTLGGIGFYMRGDRTIWTFADGHPLLVRRGEHWTAFPVQLASSISQLIGGGPAAEIVARTAYLISSRPQGAILAIVDGPETLDGAVSPKDRFDLRNEVDPVAMRPETRLHHLLDAEELDDQTLARLAALDGATIVNRAGQLLAYGAVVSSSDSQHEGARTAAARTLSHSARVVLKVSVDGDITVFQEGEAITTLLGHPGRSAPTR
jgi:hypothetical protein